MQMGLSKQHLQSQQELTKLYKILKFGVNWANNQRDTAIQTPQRVYKRTFTLLSGCNVFNIFID